MTNLTVDGVGAYDHVLRSAMLGRVDSMPAYSQPSSYQWIDTGRKACSVTQAVNNCACGSLVRPFKSEGVA